MRSADVRSGTYAGTVRANERITDRRNRFSPEAGISPRRDEVARKLAELHWTGYTDEGSDERGFPVLPPNHVHPCFWTSILRVGKAYKRRFYIRAMQVGVDDNGDSIWVSYGDARVPENEWHRVFWMPGFPGVDEIPRGKLPLLEFEGMKGAERAKRMVEEAYRPRHVRSVDGHPSSVK